MKKFIVILLATLMVVAVAFPVFAARAPEKAPTKAPANAVQWRGESDKAVAVTIDEARNNNRRNASGPRVVSNAHNENFPGLFFIWDARHRDNGYLKVKASVFDKYESFTLTAKESNTFWDFSIAPRRGQRRTGDDCYVFHIPKAQGNRNINMVFIGELVDKRAGHDLRRGNNRTRGAIQWKGESDKAAAVTINEVRDSSQRNASGPRVASNAHNADFPDLFFIWDSRHRDNGYLKVKTSVFEKYEWLTLTVRESKTSWNFSVTPQRGQRRTDDGCYVFYIPKAQAGRNISMVFISELAEKRRPR
jgi:hypothetical protein